VRSVDVEARRIDVDAAFLGDGGPAPAPAPAPPASTG
jgi:hypothetical protein